jgi:hypothetical protein
MSNLSVTDSDGTVVLLSAVGDGTSSSPLFIARASLEQSMTDAGKAFYTSGRYLLNNNVELPIQIVTPSNRKARLIKIYVYVNDAPFELTFTEAALVSVNGTQSGVFNLNRQSSNTAMTAVYSAPTVTSLGTPIISCHAQGGKDIGGTLIIDAQMILKQNERYVINLKNISTVASTLSVAVLFSEE